MLPQALCALCFSIVRIIKDRLGFGVVLAGLLLGAYYPLWVPAISIYRAARELFWGENQEMWLTRMKGFKMFEHLG